MNKQTSWYVREADWIQDQQALLVVRDNVFVKEQHVPVGIEHDDADYDAIHVLALSEEDVPIGTARLTRHHAIGRMSVIKPWRGMGIGAAMLAALVDLARQQGLPEVTLHAQTHALAFYANMHFKARGKVFMEAGIEHQEMYLLLS